MAKVTKEEYIKTCDRMAKENLHKFNEAVDKREKTTDKQERADLLLEAEGWLKWSIIWKTRAEEGLVTSFTD